MCGVGTPLLFVFVGLGLVVGYWMYWPAIRGGFRDVSSADLRRTGLSRPRHLTAFVVLWLAGAVDILLLYMHHC